jgi:RimJ/RimL family protein N-acetyltransferase
LIDDPARTLAMGDAARELVRGARPGHGSEFSIRGMAGPTPCLLRPFAPDDEATVLEWRNSARVRTRSITDRAITPAEHHVWFGRALDVLASLHWVFEVHGRPEGVVSLEAVSGDVASRAWSFYLGRDSTEPGLGTAMCRLALREAFQVEGIAHVTAEVLADNGPSLRLHERLGFQRAGMRERGRCAGPADTVLLNLARDAWRAMEETWQGTDPCGLPAIRR